MQALRFIRLFLLSFLLTSAAFAAPTLTGKCKIDSQCDDGNMCNGTEYCDSGTCARKKGSPCGEGERCDVKTQSCELRMCEQNFMCNDGNWCNGQEVCDPSRGKGTFSPAYSSGRWGCFAGQAPCADGGCDESSKSCSVSSTPTRSAGGNCSVPDADGDGHAAIACGGDDCNDTDPNINPGVTEICDAAGVDEDCDPSTIGFRDDDGDGQIDQRCCNGDRCGTDCNDKNRNISASSTEVCNNVDDDCDDQVDEGVLLAVYRDNDRDGFGDPAGMQMLCPIGNQLKNFSINDYDCNDQDKSINPARGNCP